MELGQNAYTVASHLAMVAILLLLGYRVLTAKLTGLIQLAMERGFTAAVAIAALALGLERMYYVLARLLKPVGLDLWTLHPAPEALSLIVGVGLYGIMVPMQLAGAPNDRTAWTKVTRECVLLVSVWGLMVWVLY